MTGRILYICPATQGAIVAAAPAILDRPDYEIARVLLLCGVADRQNPGPFDVREAIRPAESIARFFASAGARVDVLDAAPDDFFAWSRLVSSHLTPTVLEGIDAILLNAQGGTKQMSFGAWDGAQVTVGKRSDRRNLPIRRCFVGSGTVSYDDGRTAQIPALSFRRHLQLYGFEEVDEQASLRLQNWFDASREAVLAFGNAKLGGNAAARKGAAAALFHRGVAPVSEEHFAGAGLWLEGYVYVRALMQRDRSGNRNRKVRCGVKIKDLYAREHGPGDPNDHELDLAVTGPGVLHVVECKAGPLKKELRRGYVDRLGLLRSLLQGRAGVSALVTQERPLGRETALGLRASSVGTDWVSARNLDPLLEKVFRS